MAILARALIRDFPEYEFYFRIPAIQIGKRVIRNHNRLIGRYPGADGMKTGFICSSGFNVVAGAQREGRKLIAVVFGAYSSRQRAEDAATLLERGFRSDLMPNEIGTLEQIKNVHAAPHDMRDEMCNPKRRRPKAVSSLDEETGEDEDTAHDKDEPKSKGKRASLLGDYTTTMPPVRVFTGLPSRVPEDGIETANGADKDKKDQPRQAEKAKKSDKPRTAQADAAVVQPASAKKETPKRAQPKK